MVVVERSKYGGKQSLGCLGEYVTVVLVVLNYLHISHSPSLGEGAARNHKHGRSPSQKMPF